MSWEPVPDEVERFAREVVDAAIEVHRHLGPGFLENIDERALAHELQLRGVEVETQTEILAPFKGIAIPGQRLDLLVGRRVVVELKPVDHFIDVHTAQLLSYSKATGLRLGLLLNFDVALMKDGIERVVR